MVKWSLKDKWTLEDKMKLDLFFTFMFLVPGGVSFIGACIWNSDALLGAAAFAALGGLVFSSSYCVRKDLLNVLRSIPSGPIRYQERE